MQYKLKVQIQNYILYTKSATGNIVLSLSFPNTPHTLSSAARPYTTLSKASSVSKEVLHHCPSIHSCSLNEMFALVSAVFGALCTMAVFSANGQHSHIECHVRDSLGQQYQHAQCKSNTGLALCGSITCVHDLLLSLFSFLQSIIVSHIVNFKRN